MKVERTCPRCRCRRYHFFEADRTICCAECGHRWKGRLSQDEQADLKRTPRKQGDETVPLRDCVDARDKLTALRDQGDVTEKWACQGGTNMHCHMYCTCDGADPTDIDPRL